MIVIHRGKCWQSAGPCLKSSAADRSVLLAGEKTHRESPRHRWHWPSHTPPTAASGTNQNLRAKAEQRVSKQTDDDVFIGLFWIYSTVMQSSCPAHYGQQTPPFYKSGCFKDTVKSNVAETELNYFTLMYPNYILNVALPSVHLHCHVLSLRMMHFSNQKHVILQFKVRYPQIWIYQGSPPPKKNINNILTFAFVSPYILFYL